MVLHGYRLNGGAKSYNNYLQLFDNKRHVAVKRESSWLKKLRPILEDLPKKIRIAVGS